MTTRSSDDEQHPTPPTCTGSEKLVHRLREAVVATSTFAIAGTADTLDGPLTVGTVERIGAVLATALERLVREFEPSVARLTARRQGCRRVAQLLGEIRLTCEAGGPSARGPGPGGDGHPVAQSADDDAHALQSRCARPTEDHTTEDRGAADGVAATVASARSGSAATDDDLDTRSPDNARSPGPVLADLHRDEDLRRDGFVVIDLPEAIGVAEELAAFYAREHGLGGSGFEPDLVNPDLDYRRRVSDQLAATLDEFVRHRFVDHDPFLRVFLAKWPGPQSDLYLHRDWMYVDERSSGHTYVTWIPLCDVNDRNGPLQVLRGSHLIDDSLRGTDLNAPWINHHDVVVPRLETVTARLGQAVVLDNALVHSSSPNQSDDLRLVAAVGMRPTGAPLVHFLRADDDTAWRFDVDESFLLTTTPQGLLTSPPDLPIVERLGSGQRFWSKTELVLALGEPVPEPPIPADPTEQPSPGGGSTARKGSTPGSRWGRLRRRIQRV